MLAEPLTPEQFTTRSAPAAREHLRQLRAAGRLSETDRLAEAWWKAHGSPLETAHDEERARVATLPADRNSTMLTVGRVITLLGVFGTAFCVFIATQELAAAGPASFGWAPWTYLFSSGTGLGVLVWIAGVIEQRLIEIRERLATSR